MTEIKYFMYMIKLKPLFLVKESVIDFLCFYFVFLVVLLALWLHTFEGFLKCLRKHFVFCLEAKKSFFKKSLVCSSLVVSFLLA